MNFLDSNLASVSLLILCDLRTDSSKRRESLMLGYKSPGRQDAWANKLRNLTNNICGSSVWNFLYISHLEPKLLGLATRILENLCISYHTIYRIIHKSLRDFQPLRNSSRDGHAEGEHVNRGRDTPNICPTLQVLDMSTLGDAADVNPVIKFLPHTLNVSGRNLITGLTSVASPRVDISSTCKVGQKLGVPVPL